MVSAKNFCVVFLLSVFLSGCLTFTNVKGLAPVKASATKIENTPFDRSYKFVSRYVGGHPYAPSGTRYFLRSWKNKKSGDKSHQLYVVVVHNSGEWAFFRSAETTSAQSVKITRIGSDVNCRGSRYGGCTYEEIVGVSMSDGFLQSKRNSGFTIRLSGKSGLKRIVNVPSNYIQGHLDAMDSYPHAGGSKRPTS